jgi:hypothetical protein
MKTHLFFQFLRKVLCVIGILDSIALGILLHIKLPSMWGFQAFFVLSTIVFTQALIQAVKDSREFRALVKSIQQ